MCVRGYVRGRVAVCGEKSIERGSVHACSREIKCVDWGVLRVASQRRGLVKVENAKSYFGGSQGGKGFRIKGTMTTRGAGARGVCVR